MKFKTLDSLAQGLDSLDARLGDIAPKISKLMVGIAKRSFYLAASGPYSAKWLEEHDHPYSRRRFNPPQDPGIINLQTGKWRNSWRAHTVKTANAITTSFNNIDRYKTEQLLGGTVHMDNRPFFDTVLHMVESGRADFESEVAEIMEMTLIP